jgi:hypothetical protein
MEGLSSFNEVLLAGLIAFALAIALVVTGIQSALRQFRHRRNRPTPRRL